MKSSKDEGFTLIELLIVIVILGILAAVVVFSVSNIRDTAAENACLTEKKTVQTAVEAYYASTGNQPTAATDLVPDYLTATPTYFDVDTAGAVINKVGATMPAGCTA